MVEQEAEQEAEQETVPARKFADFPLAEDVQQVLADLGFEAPTPIQEKVILPILERKDVVGKAETGTGKTIGFGAPLVGRIDTERVAVQALVLTPTRELAQQVAGVLEQLGARRNLGVALVVGGVHASGQIEKLRSGSQLVVGTPGRVLEFVGERILSLAWCETAVLDEADRMLDMGFIEDVGKILERVPSERQTLLFSATLPPEIHRLLDRYMRDPVTFSTSSGLSTVPDIAQKYVEVEFPSKFRELRKILDRSEEDTAIIFCNTRRQAIDLDRMMWGHGYSAGALHGDQDQDSRFRVLEAFRKSEIRILVATDVASRGLDIEGVTRVINYEVPDEAEAYVHRIGRTGRASRTGEAVTLVASKEWRQWQNLLDTFDFEITREGPQRIRRGRGRGGAGDSRDPRDRDDGRSRSRSSRSGRGGASSRRRGRGANGAAMAAASDDRADGADGASPESESDTSSDRAESGARKDSGDRSDGESQGRRRRPRRRRKSRGGRDGSATDASTSRPDGDSREERANDDRRSRDEAPDEGSEGSGEIPERWGDPGAARQRQNPREKKKIDLVDDDFIKTDYFDVDTSRIPTRRSSSSGDDRPSDRRSSRRSRSGRRSGGERPGGERSGGERSASGARGAGSRSRSGGPSEGSGEEKREPGRRRRSRRRRRPPKKDGD